MFMKRPIPQSTTYINQRTIPSRNFVGINNRPLSKQFIGNHHDSQSEGYIVEIREKNATNKDTNTSPTINTIPQPWVIIRDKRKRENVVGMPVTICNVLLQHFLSCAQSKNQNHDSEDSEVALVSSEEASEYQSSSLTHASGDGKKSAVKISDDAKVNTFHKSKSKVFCLRKLLPIRILCDTTGCVIEVTNRKPMIKRPASTDVVILTGETRRWIVSIPIEAKVNVPEDVEKTGDSALDSSNVGKSEKRTNPWKYRSAIEIHENLLPKLSVCLADVIIRYHTTSNIPKVKPLFSVSGDREFYFDLRDTRWGRRLHISQLTDLHRNVIGIPLESLVSFRSRLDKIIECLRLDDQYTLKSTISGGRGSGGEETEEDEKLHNRRFVANSPRNDENSIDPKDGTMMMKKRNAPQRYRPQMVSYLRNIPNNNNNNNAQYTNNRYGPRSNMAQGRRGYWNVGNRGFFHTGRGPPNHFYQNQRLGPKQNFVKNDERNAPNEVTQSEAQTNHHLVPNEEARPQM